MSRALLYLETASSIRPTTPVCVLTQPITLQHPAAITAA